MELYTGACGSLVSTGNCASGNSGTGGSMAITFATVAGTTYFVMIDGNSGNDETFDIIATTVDDAIVARPDANFNVDPPFGCTPLNVLCDNITALHGGTNITYEWRINTGGWLPATGADTTVTLAVVDTHTVTLRVCNLQCGCKTVSQDVTVQDLYPTISYLPPTGCIGSPINFTGAASVLPLPPSVPPDVTLWTWDFGDPASGPANTATGQSVFHTYDGPGTSYTVKLVIQGTCGPDSVTTVINLAPKPVISITAPTEICEGVPLNLSSSISNATPPYTYDWQGVGTFSCTNCPATIVTDLFAGGPYTFDFEVTDSLGCTADTSFDVTVNELPVVFAGGIITVCPSDSAQLDAIAFNGWGPYTFAWTPTTGLSDSTIADPYTFNTNNVWYTVTVTDFLGCTSTPDSVNILQYPIPTIQPSSADLCTSQIPLTNDFNVIGANPGSTYSWALSPDYALITAATPDSSGITATFPPVVGTYDFIAIISDGLTGCIDTVPTSFSVTAGLSMSVTGPSIICSGDSATLTVTGADTYSWSANPPYFFADPNDSVQTVQPLVPTIFTITGTQGTCTQDLDYTLNVSAYPNAVINPIASFCGCTNVSLNGSGSTAGMDYLWLSQSGSFIFSDTSLITAATICANDSIFFTVTDPVSGCATTVSDGVTSRPRPNVVATVSPDTICNGVVTPVVLDGTGSNTVTGTTYLWTSSPAVAIANDTSLNTTSSVNGATQFTLTVTDSSGCDSSAVAQVYIHPLPVISASGPFICNTDPLLQSTITVTGASPGSTYLWTLPGCVTPGTASTSSQLFDFATCGLGSFNFDIDVIDAVTTCTTNVSTSVSVVAGVTLTVTADNDTICEGGSVMLAASGANSYSWSSGELVDTIYPSPLTAANSPYTFVVVGTVGLCSDTDSIVIVVNPLPLTDSIIGPVLVCENDTNVIYSVLNTAGSTYNWSVAGGLLQAGQGFSSILVDWNTNGAAFISVVETNSFGCDGLPQSLSFVINPIPAAPVVTGPDTVCQSDISTYFVNPSAGSTFNWTITGGTYLLGQTGVVNIFQWDSIGNQNLNVYEVTSPGCSGPSTNYGVFVNAKPLLPILTGNNMVCDNITQYYNISSNAGSIYTWSVVGAASVVPNVAGDSITVDWGTPGVGSVKVFETNTAGCVSDTASISVSIYNHPVANIPNPSDSICNGAYQVISSATTPNVKWTTDGGGTFNNDSITTPVYTPAVTDTGYTHLYMVVNNPACLNDTGEITLYITPSPIVTVTGPLTPICYGSIDSLRATGGGTYVWTPGGIPGPVIGIRPIVNTTYFVTVTNTYNCATVDSYPVTVIPPGIADAGSDQSICAGDVVLLNGSQVNGVGLYWTSAGDGTFSPDTVSPAVTYNPGASDTTNGSATIYLTTVGACLDQSDSVTVLIERQPLLIASADTTISSEPSENATIPLLTLSANVTSVQWTTTGSGVFIPSDTSLSAVYDPSDDDYKLTQLFIIGTTTGNCATAIDTLIIDFTPFFIPNVFTPFPLSPGYNDYFRIGNYDTRVGLKVWDRWGSLVYTSDQYQNDWDGHGLDAGVYYYIVTSPEKEYKGWVQLIRE